MENLKKLLENYLGKDLEIEIDGEVQSCSMLDWNQIILDNDEWAKGMEGMTDQEKDAYCNHSVSDFATIYQYFLDEEEFELKVDNKQWIPFAVLGMYKPHIHGYAEMNHNGMLLFDLEEDAENPPIIYILDGEQQLIATDFSELSLEEIADND
ncbi:hypothetical protein [Fluviicola taffensis]|uniref:hypothetical protein n=1 Tax=Fluviicola taffensis TaxID=191579 RepID=UPI00313788E3